MAPSISSEMACSAFYRRSKVSFAYSISHSLDRRMSVYILALNFALESNLDYVAVPKMLLLLTMEWLTSIKLC